MISKTTNGEKWRIMAKNGEKWRWRICLFHLSNSPFRHWPPPPCGVIYRPPSGNFEAFVEKFEHINTFLPNSGVRIMGDFNINLTKLCEPLGNGSNQPSNFEEVFVKHGLAPVISIPTHRRDGCKPSCIDNIFSIYVFLWRSHKKNKYRWFKVEGFGDG